MSTPIGEEDFLSSTKAPELQIALICDPTHNPPSPLYQRGEFATLPLNRGGWEGLEGGVFIISSGASRHDYQE